MNGLKQLFTVRKSVVFGLNLLPFIGFGLNLVQAIEDPMKLLEPCLRLCFDRLGAFKTISMHGVAFKCFAVGLNEIAM